MFLGLQYGSRRLALGVCHALSCFDVVSSRSIFHLRCISVKGDSLIFPFRYTYSDCKIPFEREFSYKVWMVSGIHGEHLVPIMPFHSCNDAKLGKLDFTEQQIFICFFSRREELPTKFTPYIICLFIGENPFIKIILIRP